MSGLAVQLTRPAAASRELTGKSRTSKCRGHRRERNPVEASIVRASSPVHQAGSSVEGADWQIESVETSRTSPRARAKFSREVRRAATSASAEQRTQEHRNDEAEWSGVSIEKLHRGFHLLLFNCRRCDTLVATSQLSGGFTTRFRRRARAVRRFRWRDASRLLGGRCGRTAPEEARRRRRTGAASWHPASPARLCESLPWPGRGRMATGPYRLSIGAAASIRLRWRASASRLPGLGGGAQQPPGLLRAPPGLEARPQPLRRVAALAWARPRNRL